MYLPDAPWVLVLRVPNPSFMGGVQRMAQDKDHLRGPVAHGRKLLTLSPFKGDGHLSARWASRGLAEPPKAARQPQDKHLQLTLWKDQMWFSSSSDLQALEKAQLLLPLTPKQILAGCCNYL